MYTRMLNVGMSQLQYAMVVVVRSTTGTLSNDVSLVFCIDQYIVVLLFVTGS